MMPVVLEVAARTPGIPLAKFALLLAYSHGLMGVLTPYATTSGPVYLGSGYIRLPELWLLGLAFGGIFFLALIGLAGPMVLWWT